MENKNINYRTRNISEFYSSNRSSWNNLYQSEKKIIEQSGLCSSSKVLDIGCACGGLGAALKERFGVTSYFGLDINEEAIYTGIKKYSDFNFVCGDFLNDKITKLLPSKFDYIFSLGYFDWNLEYEAMFTKLWNILPINSTLIFSIRLTEQSTISDFKKSNQKIVFKETEISILETELAPYIIFNAKEKMKESLELNFSRLDAFGFIGKPAKTVNTIVSDVCFAVFSIRKSLNSDLNSEIQLDFPKKIFQNIFQ